jgi:hypothetical protein
MASFYQIMSSIVPTEAIVCSGVCIMEAEEVALSTVAWLASSVVQHLPDDERRGSRCFREVRKDLNDFRQYVMILQSVDKRCFISLVHVFTPAQPRGMLLQETRWSFREISWRCRALSAGEMRKQVWTGPP